MNLSLLLHILTPQSPVPRLPPDRCWCVCCIVLAGGQQPEECELLPLQRLRPEERGRRGADGQRKGRRSHHKEEARHGKHAVLVIAWLLSLCQTDGLMDCLWFSSTKFITFTVSLSRSQSLSNNFRFQWQWSEKEVGFRECKFTSLNRTVSVYIKPIRWTLGFTKFVTVLFISAIEAEIVKLDLELESFPTLHERWNEMWKCYH